MMSNAPKEEDGQHVQHAGVPSRKIMSPRSRPVISPNRLFTTHWQSIIKNKTRESQNSPEFSRCDEVEVREEASSGPDPNLTPPNILDVMQDQQEVCDVVVEASEPKSEPLDTSICVKSENFDETFVRDDTELSPGSSVTDLTSLSPSRVLSSFETSRSDEDVDFGSLDCSKDIIEMNNNESPKKPPPKSISNSRSNTKSKSRQQSHCSKSTRSEQKYLHEDRKHTHKRSHSNRERSATGKRERSSTRKRERSSTRKREKSNSQHQSHQASSELRCSRSRRKNSEKEESDSKLNLHVNAGKATSRRQYSNNAGSHDQSPDNLKVLKFSEQPKSSPVSYSDSSVVKPLMKMSSSETYVDIPASPESDDEQIIDHKIFTVSDKDLVSSCSSLSNQDDSMHSKSSSTQSSSFSVGPSSDQNVLLRPDTYYRMPTPTPPSEQWNSAITLNPSLPTMLHNFNHPPPPPAAPAPLMKNGVFQWHVYPPSPISSPDVRSQTIPNSLNSLPTVEKRFQQQQNFHNPPRPSFHGYQLIGDSMLLRFSQKILNESIIFAEGLRFLGFCVSGQKIGELLKRLKNGFYHLGKKVVVMIGTNDLLQNTQMSQMCAELQKVVEYLCAKAEEVILLTLPPIPRLESTSYHWRRLDDFNKFIQHLGNKDSKILVLDIFPLYVLNQEELQLEELMAQFNAKTLFCQGCLTCLEESEDYDDDYSSQSDEEDELSETALLTHTYISTIPRISTLDVSSMFTDRRIRKCRIECFELFFSDSDRKDLIHLNLKGLQVVHDQLKKFI